MVRENVGVVIFDFGQNRHSGQGCRQTVGFHLYQYVQHTKGWARALWSDAARRWHAMDGNKTARLGDNHYVMTTTTAAAGLVMRHLDFVTQCLHPEWDVSFISVTEQWAQFAVAGPKARDLVAILLRITQQ